MLDRVREIVADVTQNSIDEITEGSGSRNTDGWDDLAQVSILATIEMDFGVSFTPEEMTALNSVRKILQALKMQVAA
jgi:acyl carrier protein